MEKSKIATVWTSHIVAHRVAEFLAMENHVREARFVYEQSCDKFREVNDLQGAALDTSDENFRRATSASYGNLKEARKALHNAKRRLQTAVRNWRGEQ